MRLEHGLRMVFFLLSWPARRRRDDGLTPGRRANGSRNLAREVATVPSNSVALPAAGLIVNDHAICATSLRATEPAGWPHNRCSESPRDR